ncbi:MAG: ABC transporter permease [Thermodesulfobacteriota bacterium]
MSLLALQLRIALRNVLRNRRRTWLTVAAVAFSIFCLIVFQALLAGLHDKMVESGLGMDLGSLQIHAAGYEANLTTLPPIPEPEAVLQVLRQAGVEHVAPRLKTPALLLAGPRSSSVLLSGIEAGEEARVTFIAGKMSGGEYDPGPDRLLVSEDLAASLGVGLGGTVTLLAQDGFGRPVTRRLAVGGLFATGLGSFDRTHVYMRLADVQRLLDVPEEVSEIAVRVEPAEAVRLAPLLAERFGPGLQVRDWRTLAPDLVQLMELNTATFRLLIGIVFLIVAMGIANTMTTVIFERFREFGTLAAIGTTPAGIVAMVLLEALLLGLFASLLGGAAAVAACRYLASQGIDLGHFTSANQYFAAGAVLYADLGIGDMAAAILTTVLTALVAGLLPALRAARLEPVEALRHS